LTRNKILERYYRENYDHLIKYARYRVGNYHLYNAEDAVQEAFLRSCRYWRTYNREEDLDKWFKKILRNCINKMKSEQRNNGVVYTDEHEPLAELETLTFSKEIEEGIIKSTDRDKRILDMRFFYGFKTIEISNMLEVSHDVVRDVIRRFKMRIRR
jgi:RNA polymerase sigma factor (sigma-70 family)